MDDSRRGDSRDILSSLLSALGGSPHTHCAWLESNEEQVLSVARLHRLSPSLSIACAQTLPATLREGFRKDHLQSIARNLVLGKLAAECLRALQAAAIPVAVMKGLAYEATFYRGSNVRMSADVDLLIPDSHRRAAFSVFDHLGFQPQAAAPGFDDPGYYEVTWTRGGMNVDLHMALVPVVRCNIDYHEVWTNLQDLIVAGQAARGLASRHAAVYHALHMAKDHFDVPAIYLLDFARLLPSKADVVAAEAIALRWRCHRPFVTTRALVGAFLPQWAGGQTISALPWYSTGIVSYYGTTEKLPRSRQLFRKMAHFDTVADAARYTATQGRLHAREWLEIHTRKRSPRERLSLNGAERS